MSCYLASSVTQLTCLYRVIKPASGIRASGGDALLPVGLFLGAQLRCYQAHLSLHHACELTFGKPRVYAQELSYAKLPVLVRGA